MNWWPFRRKLPPIKEETRQHDHEIIALDRAVAEEHAATHQSHRRLQRAIDEMGEQFAIATAQITRRVVDPNGNTH